MVLCLIALGAVWVVLNPAPMVQTAKEPPVKKTLAYQDALAARDQEIGKKESAAAEPSSVEDILADDQAQAKTSEDGAQQDLAALPDGTPAEPLPWNNQQPGVQPQAGYPPNGAPQAGYPPQDPYGQPQYPRADPYGQGASPPANPYGQNAPGGQNPYQQNAPGQNPYAANVPGGQDISRQNPPRDPYAPPGAPGDAYGAPPPGQTAYPGQDPYGQNPYGQDLYGQQDAYGQDPYGTAPDPQAPYGRDPYSQEPLGPDGQVANAGPNAFPGEPPYPGQAQPPYPGQAQPPYPGQAQPPYPGQAPYGGAQQEWVRVIGSGTGMRNTASEDAPILFAFPYGRNLQVVSRNGDWVEVKDPNSSAKGWMQAHALAPTANPYAQQQPYFEEPKEERRGIFGGFIKRAFGN